MPKRRCTIAQSTVIFLLLTLLHGMVIAAPFSNVIFFGDSLSDLGNFPIAKYPYLQKKLPPSLPNLYNMFYVPVSNPVNLQGNKLSIVELFKLKHLPYLWPSDAENLLPLLPKIEGKVRESRSYSWTQFFVTDAYQDGLLQTAKIVPSMVIRERHLHLSINYSVDYAFADATSSAGCNFRYRLKKNKNCSYQTILTSSKKFEQNSTLDNYNHVIVPGLLEQINLFITDVYSSRVKINNQTVYVIWVGGNDFLRDKFLFKSPLWKQKLIAMENIANGAAVDNQRAITTLIETPGIKAKNIIIFGFFNPVITPAMHKFKWIERVVITAVVDHYNYQLKKIVQELVQKYPDVNIQYEPVPRWFAEMVDTRSKYNKVFDANKMGIACQLADKNYNNAVTPNANCQGYLFWNGVHPSSSVEQILGYLVDKSLALYTSHLSLYALAFHFKNIQ